MINRRLIACLIIKNGIVVQSIGFEKYLPVGKPEIAAEFLNRWGIDEIILLDMDATPQGRGPDFEMVRRVAKKCFVPLTVGGGIADVETMRKLIRNGADKVCMNTSAIRHPELIQEAADVLGNQCLVVSMDVRRKKDERCEVFMNSGRSPTDLNPAGWAQRVEDLGAGEIFLNSIDRDGSKSGYDLELIRTVTQAVSIPVIACGGVGCPEHFVEGLVKGNATAVAAGNYFHFTQHSPIAAKSFLRQKENVRVRLDTHATYADFSFDDLGRVGKRTDAYLNKIRFEYQEKEVI